MEMYKMFGWLFLVKHLKNRNTTIPNTKEKLFIEDASQSEIRKTLYNKFFFNYIFNLNNFLI